MTAPTRPVLRSTWTCPVDDTECDASRAQECPHGDPHPFGDGLLLPCITLEWGDKTPKISLDEGV